ncbi:CbtB domain-containing protein [Micropruina sonneratiae]|uniref:CbtB domain-containing protein n=1 Tax=Micropruina sonneratiae TaxID=2986940 RepID=UPI00222708E9|nr:CbtB domain-containing protein [Micropruina sp. KQZ13P-5]MCW3158781.1 CbtB-domain containing protein [Micropruina sp. KQZ13P-5]
MSAAAIPNEPAITVELPTLSLRELWPWILFSILIALLAVYFVGAEQGATSVFSGTAVHEWVHDARHLLGFPCH